MEGVQRVYMTGVRYVKQRYIPNPSLSILYIVFYTAFVFLLTEYLMRGVVTRWLYIGTFIMVVSMVYSGAITLDNV